MIGIVLYLTSLQPEQVVPVCFVNKRYFACPISARVYRDLNNPARRGKMIFYVWGNFLVIVIQPKQVP